MTHVTRRRFAVPLVSCLALSATLALVPAPARAQDVMTKESVAELKARLASNLERSRSRLRDTAWRRAVMESFKDALLITDAFGQVIEVNEAFTQLLGYSLEDGRLTMPHPWWPAAGVPEDAGSDEPTDRELIEQVMGDALRGSTVSGQECRLVTRDHRDVWVQVSTQQVEGIGGELRGHHPVPAPAYLREVADPLQQAIRDPWGAARPAGDERGRVIGQRDVEDLGRTTEDVLELGIGVVVQPERRAEPVAQRSGDAPDTGGGTDDGHVLDLEPHGASTRALAEHDVESEVLHRRVEDLLDRVTEPMNLVDEEHVARAEAGQDGGEVARPLDGGSGGRPDLGAHLGRDDVRERRLAEPGWPVQEDVIDRLPQLGARAAYFKQAIHEKLIEHKQYIASRGDDMPTIRGWKWGANPQVGPDVTSTEGDNV